MKFKDKVVVITGASSGIGRELAFQCVEKGAKVVLAARSKDVLEDIVRQINSTGGVARAIPTDVSKRSQIENLVSKSLQEFGRIDVFINNAGVTHPTAELVNIQEEDFRRVWETNVMASVYSVWSAAPVMEKAGGGLMVFVSSVIGKRGIPMNSGYCTSKFALQGLVESIRPELKKKNIHSLLVCPPGVDTPFFSNNKRGPRRNFFLHPTKKIVKMMIRACEKEKREVWLTWDAMALIWANAFVPGILDRVIPFNKGD